MLVFFELIFIKMNIILKINKIKINKTNSRKCFMNKILQLVIIFGVCLLNIACQQTSTKFLPKFPVIDLMITTGKVLDGLGNKAISADILIVDDKIVFIGKTLFDEHGIKGRVKTTIDAKGRVVTPGFIDLHTHGSPLKTPKFENFIDYSPMIFCPK